MGIYLDFNNFLPQFFTVVLLTLNTKAFLKQPILIVFFQHI